ncbi:hypothetical protein E1162_05855 [Rhodobacteraceae bacterium RKSG542]|uniref:hypothetical protein n=1 Tax=Pseudovibrio flavus TaxID=2529854 RepID=UPI0012BD5F36|nr:hypothetical protein [Pseudovibrio flavus]MTI16757.1 hypothetical protein [Pseudovibrio flavus]
MANTQVPEVFEIQQELVVAEESAPIKFVSNEDVVAINSILSRVEALVEEEIAGLTNQGKSDLDDTAYRKYSAMLELEKVSEIIRPENLPSETVERLQTLKDRLQFNMRLLDTHLTAVRNVSESISSRIREIESDGTYDATAGHY